MTEAPAAIGVDVGGTNLRIALVTQSGMVLEQRRLPSPTDDAAAFLDTVVDAHGDLTSSLAQPRLPVGLGVASLVRDRRVAVYGPNLRIGEVDLVEELGRRGLSRVIVENDANAAAWGEYRAGSGRGHDHVLMVTIGTGVGGGAIVDGRLLRGANGFGGEAGHTSLVVDGRRCACGRRGCLEAYASGTAIAQTAQDLLDGPDGPASSLAELAEVDGTAVGVAAEAGDTLAVRVLEQTGRWLGIGLVGMVNLLDPSIVVVGGGAGVRNGHLLLPAVATALAREIEGHQHREPPGVVPATLGDDAGIVGAALLALESTEPSETS